AGWAAGVEVQRYLVGQRIVAQHDRRQNEQQRHKPEADAGQQPAVGDGGPWRRRWLRLPPRTLLWLTDRQLPGLLDPFDEGSPERLRIARRDDHTAVLDGDQRQP